MNKDEILELSKVESGKNCCTFCQSKCTQCGSVNIEVVYYRFYDLVNDRMVFVESVTDVCCHNCGIQVDNENNTLQIPEGVCITGQGNISIEIIKEKHFISTPALAEQIDYYFEDDS